MIYMHLQPVDLHHDLHKYVFTICLMFVVFYI